MTTLNVRDVSTRMAQIEEALSHESAADTTDMELEWRSLSELRRWQTDARLDTPMVFEALNRATRAFEETDKHGLRTD